MVAYLFKVDDQKTSEEPYLIMRELVMARKRGVDVMVVLEYSSRDDSLSVHNRLTAEILRREGISVRLDDPAKTTHAKVAIIDERYVFVGSHNLTWSAMNKNREVSVMVDSPAMAARMKQYVEGIR